MTSRSSPHRLAGTGFVQGVRTFDQPALDAACHELRRLVVADFQPDALIGIRTGGLVVAAQMAAGVGGDVPVLALTCRRPSTSVKHRSMGGTRWLARLPRPARDRLRLLEHRLLTRGRAVPSLRTTRDVDAAELGAIRSWCADAGPDPRILIVDDAVDTGTTLAHALEVVAACAPPGASIRSAVITVTTAQPVVAPDYALMQGWLCRFPWSMDA